MPFKSQAQRRKFAKMMVDGEISPETFEEWSRETGSAKLPERVGKKRAKKAPAKKRPVRKTRAKKAAKAGREKTRKTARKRTAKKTRRS